MGGDSIQKMANSLVLLLMTLSAPDSQQEIKKLWIELCAMYLDWFVAHGV